MTTKKRSTTPPDSRAPTKPPERSRAETVTKEDALEIARLRSMSLSERPSPTSSANLLSLADAYNGAIPSPAFGIPAVVRQTPSPGGELPERDAGSPHEAAARRGAASATTSATTRTEGDTRGADEVTADMRDRVSVGDYTGALAAAERALELEPANVEALRCAESCRAVLQQMYTARIGPLDRVPHVLVPHDQLRWLSIDHRAGFMLSHIDGVSSVEMILDVSGMPLLEALRILVELVQQRVIAFR